MSLGTVNGVKVTSAERVPWKPDDDPVVRAACDARGLVLFDGGGKSDAIVIGRHAIIWERQGERFRAFDVSPVGGMTRVAKWWSVGVPGSTSGAMIRVGWDEDADVSAARGASVEVVMAETVRFTSFVSKRELRRLLSVAMAWPGMDGTR